MRVSHFYRPGDAIIRLLRDPAYRQAHTDLVELDARVYEALNKERADARNEGA